MESVKLYKKRTRMMLDGGVLIICRYPINGIRRSRKITSPTTINCITIGKGIVRRNVCSLKLHTFHVKTARIPIGVVKFHDNGKKQPSDLDILSLITCDKLDPP